MVREITSKADFDAALVDAGDKLVVVDFAATWCGRAERLRPNLPTSPTSTVIKPSFSRSMSTSVDKWRGNRILPPCQPSNFTNEANCFTSFEARQSRKSNRALKRTRHPRRSPIPMRKRTTRVPRLDASFCKKVLERPRTLDESIAFSPVPVSKTKRKPKAMSTVEFFFILENYQYIIEPFLSLDRLFDGATYATVDEADVVGGRPSRKSRHCLVGGGGFSFHDKSYNRIRKYNSPDLYRDCEDVGSSSALRPLGPHHLQSSLYFLSRSVLIFESRQIKVTFEGRPKNELRFEFHRHRRRQRQSTKQNLIFVADGPVCCRIHTDRRVVAVAEKTVETTFEVTRTRGRSFARRETDNPPRKDELLGPLHTPTRRRRIFPILLLPAVFSKRGCLLLLQFTTVKILCKRSFCWCGFAS